jgi:hypothetical protein
MWSKNIGVSASAFERDEKSGVSSLLRIGNAARFGRGMHVI